MTQKKDYTIRCPRCGKEQDVTLYEAISVRELPALRDELLANRINAVTCVQCRFEFRVDKPLLYSDSPRNLLIYLLPLRQADHAAGVQQFRDSLAGISQALPADIPAPSLHLVFNRTELIERIFIVEAGLDERVIEYVKYLVYSLNPGKLDPARKSLLFDAQDSNAENLCFVVQDTESRKLESMLHFRRKDYEALQQAFNDDEKTPNLMELFPGPYISARDLLLDQADSPAPARAPQLETPPA